MLTATAPEAPTPTLLLDSTDHAPRHAREFLADRFREWGIKDDYVGRPVVCELVTNAWRHGEGPIIVRLYRDERDGLVVIEVWDQAKRRVLAEVWRLSMLAVVAHPQPLGVVYGQVVQLVGRHPAHF